MQKQATRKPQAGFTLIELVVVVGILVTLAGLVLPNLDVFVVKANKGAASANMADISRQIQAVYAQTTNYPDRWDSLLTNTGALWAPGAPGSGQAGLDPALVGGPPAGSPTKLTTATLTENGTLHQVRSLTRVGINTVLDVDPAGPEAPGDRGTVLRTLADGATIATVNLAEPATGELVNHLYPQQADPENPVLPAGKHLAVFGLGPTNSMIGSTLQATPFYPGTNAKQYYNRFLPVYEYSDDGTAARLLAVIGGDGDHVDSEITDYFQQ